MYYHLFPIVVIDVLARLQILYETFNPDIMTDFQFDYGSDVYKRQASHFVKHWYLPGIRRKR